MTYRTKTYIAGDWTKDKNLIDYLYWCNNSNRWGLSFPDAHEMTQARDTSLPCSIKRSLREHLDHSKQFVLIVGDKTAALTKGACRYCSSYSSYFGCRRGHTLDQRSFIDFECEYAAKNNLDVVVLYNFLSVIRSKCPEDLRYMGIHLAAYFYGQDGIAHWNYEEIRRAING